MAIHVTREDVIRIAGSPITQNITPAYPGQICLDMLAKECYIAYSISPSSWQPLQSKLDINFDNLAADQVAYRNNDDPDSTIRTVKDALDKLFYKDVNILQFDCEEGTKFERGQILNSLRFVWNYNKSNILYQYINGNAIGSTERSYLFNNLVSSDKEFVLQVEDGNSHSERRLQIRFLDKGYWGVSREPDEYTDKFIKNSLQTKELIQTRIRDITVNAGKDEYIYYIIPSNLATGIKFVNNNFEGGFTLVKQLEVTNDFNVKAGYDIYRSDFPNLGNTKISIK